MSGSRRISAFLGLCALALLVGLWGFRSRSLTHDEVVTWLLARSPFVDALRADVHPPLFYAWFAPLRAVCGRPEALRPLSAAVAALAIVPFFLLLRPSVPTGLSLLGVALLALSPLRVQASHLARSYSFLLLFEALAILAAVRAYERGGKGWGWYALVSTLGALTHPLALLTLLGRLFLFGIRARRERAARLLLAASAIPLLLFSGWEAARGLPSNLSASPSLKGWMAGFILALEEPSTSFVTSFWRLPEGVQRLLFMLWPIPAGLAIYGSLRARPMMGICLASWLGGGAALGVLCGLGKTVPLAIYALLLLPGFLVCFVGGLDRLLRSAPRAALALSALALLLNLGGTVAYLSRGGDNLDWRRVAREVERLALPEAERSAAVCRPPAAASVLRFYVRSIPVLPREPVLMVLGGRQVLPSGSPYRGERSEAREGLGFERIILVNWLWRTPPKAEVPSWLVKGGYRRLQRVKVEGYAHRVVLDVYERGGERFRP